jgi:DNA-binding MarR family transcriptional regulator
MANTPDLVLQLIALQDALGGQYAELSRPKLRLMVKLEQGPVSVSELAERLHISSPAVSQMIDKLSADGFVRRESLREDQRVVAAVLTVSGRDVLARALDAFRRRVDDLLSPLSDEQRAQLSQLLDQALGAVQS